MEKKSIDKTTYNMKKISILFHENVSNNTEKKIQVYRYNT